MTKHTRVFDRSPAIRGWLAAQLIIPSARYRMRGCRTDLASHALYCAASSSTTLLVAKVALNLCAILGAHTDRCIMCAHQEGYPHRGPGLVPRCRLSFAKHLGRLPRYVAEVKLLNVAIMRQASCLLFAVPNFEKVVRVVGRWLESRTKEGFRGLFPRLCHRLNALMLLHLDSATSVPRPLEESTKTRGTDISSQDMRPVESTRCCNNGDNSCAIRSAI
jgi:hypothetical protein